MTATRIYLLAFFVPLVAGCTDLRDLHDTTDVVLQVEASWINSLGRESVHDATVLMHHSGDDDRKEYFSRPNGATVEVSKGEYDVMVFNGVMESESVTNLDHVYFRGTDRLDTFEAYAAQVTPLARLGKAENEYIASNEMELFTFAHHPVSIDTESHLYVRYDNGRQVGDDTRDHVAGRIDSAPKAMSFIFQVRMTNIINPVSARSVSGALRGFLGSAFMPARGERPRPGFDATHHLTLTQPAGTRTTRQDDVERGMLVSQKFLSFGPPLPQGDQQELAREGQYFFEPVFVLYDEESTEFRTGPIDVTDQVNRTIDRLMEHHGQGEEISLDENIFEIIIDREVELPKVDGGGPGDGDGNGQVSVDDWEDGDVGIIWVRPW